MATALGMAAFNNILSAAHMRQACRGRTPAVATAEIAILRPATNLGWPLSLAA
jgi:hypothetical protein